MYVCVCLCVFLCEYVCFRVSVCVRVYMTAVGTKRRGPHPERTGRGTTAPATPCAHVTFTCSADIAWVGGSGCVCIPYLNRPRYVDVSGVIPTCVSVFVCVCVFVCICVPGVVPTDASSTCAFAYVCESLCVYVVYVIVCECMRVCDCV